MYGVHVGINIWDIVGTALRVNWSIDFIVHVLRKTHEHLWKQNFN